MTGLWLSYSGVFAMARGCATPQASTLNPSKQAANFIGKVEIASNRAAEAAGTSPIINNQVATVTASIRGNANPTLLLHRASRLPRLYDYLGIAPEGKQGDG